MPEILYQDAAIVAAVKPVGVRSEGEGENDMPMLLQKQLGGAIYPVHRLDQPTGGVMVYARTKQAAAKLSAGMQTEAFGKEYLAVLDGAWPTPEGDLCDLLFYDRRKGKSFVVRRERSGVKQAQLCYQVLGQRAGRTLVRVRLQTGRTHQIRVQFASRGFPLAGDGKYGSRENGCTAALWSARLHVVHPVTGETLCFSAQPPQAWPWTLFDGLCEISDRRSASTT